MTDNFESPLLAADIAWSNDNSYYTGELPVIEVQGGGLSDEATQAENALISAKIPIYQRGNKLVRPIVQGVNATKNRKTTIATLVGVTPERLTDALCKCAKWERYNAKIKGMVTINPPANIAKTILARGGDWKFKKVLGIITTPTLRPDGSILDKLGYDEKTGLILIEYPKMPHIPNMPSMEEALKALGLLEDLISEFPFVDEYSRSVALSALITPVVRGAMSVVPMHVMRASTPGTGKSYLLDVAAAIALGQPCPVMAAGRNEEETEKRLGAALIAGQQIISLDNINGDLGGDSLCQIVERILVQVRILGKSEQVTIEANSTIFATGNNIRLVGDMNRRALVCTLDANVERPELRKFDTNPVEKVLGNRGKYIAAVLTIIRAYIVAGKPDLIIPKLASFEDWSDLIRSALVWLGKADPVKTMESARAEDPFLQNLRAVLHSIEYSIGLDRPKTAKEIVDMALDKEKYPDLYNAIATATGDRKEFITAKELGKWLGRHEGRIIDNLKITKKNDNSGHGAKWWVTKSAVEAIESG